METPRRGTLPFHFTPVDAPTPLHPANPHAKRSGEVEDTVSRLRDTFGATIREVSYYAGETTILVDTPQIVPVCEFLFSLGFDYLADLGGIDRFTEDERFEVYYNIVNFETRKRLRLQVRVEEDQPVVPSVTSVYRAANWNEREAWDMLGIRFEGHEDLRRMYMPEDFEYHPLRKEFPLLGVPGSLPLPAQVPNGPLNYDPFPAARQQTVKSFEEPPVDPDAGASH